MITRYPEPEDSWYRSSRFWTYSARSWDPRWFHKLGVPSFASDEWGRKTIVWGLGYVGYAVWAYRTCWCQDCHRSREETYRMEVGEYSEYRDKLDRGQCTCFSEVVWRHWRHKEMHPHQRIPVLVPAQACLKCGHTVGEHDRGGNCTYVDVSMAPTETAPLENLEVGPSGDLEIRPVVQPGD